MVYHLLLLICFFPIVSQTGIKYQVKYINKKLIDKLVESVRQKNKSKYDSLNIKYRDNLLSDSGEYIPSVFNTEYEDLPNVCYSYQSYAKLEWEKANKLFEITSYNKITYDLDNYYIRLSKPRSFN